MKLGCCYYPEHWPEAIWAEDARRMREMGLSLVRIGEFAWSRIEPEPGHYDWGWLDRAIDTLHAAGLKVILGTPTATPPKWLVDRMPDMVAIDEQGRLRGFGSRRHYCFSHEGYREECRRIVTALAQRYGRHPAIAMWQTDNEYGCHDTVLSFSAAAAAAFRGWCAARYGTVQALNTAWGNVFWSMEYRSFAEIDPPHLTVTEANPTHWLDYRRFASDQVAISCVPCPRAWISPTTSWASSPSSITTRWAAVSTWRRGIPTRSASSNSSGSLRKRRSLTCGRATPTSPPSTMISIAVARMAAGG
jgi:beta-galactosidase